MASARTKAHVMKVLELDKGSTGTANVEVNEVTCEIVEHGVLYKAGL